MEQNACETTGRCLFHFLYLHLRCSPRNVLWDQSLMRNFQAFFNKYLNLPIPTLWGFVSACQQVHLSFEWILPYSWNSNFHYKQKMSVKKEQIVFVRTFCVCIHFLAHTLVFTPACCSSAYVTVLVSSVHSVDSGKVAAPQWLSCLLFCNESIPHLGIRLQPTWLSTGNCWD